MSELIDRTGGNPGVLHCDQQTAIKWALSEIDAERTKSEALVRALILLEPRRCLDSDHRKKVVDDALTMAGFPDQARRDAKRGEG